MSCGPEHRQVLILSLHEIVITAQAGIQIVALDSRLRGNDECSQRYLDNARFFIEDAINHYRQMT
jgi:hypothetical protein